MFPVCFTEKLEELLLVVICTRIILTISAILAVYARIWSDTMWLSALGFAGFKVRSFWIAFNRQPEVALH